MKKLNKVVVLMTMMVVIVSCAPKTYYKVFFDGNLIENRYYVKGRLKSVVAYNLSNTKDSIIYNGSLESFHWDNNEYVGKDANIFEKFYYPDFNNSLRNDYIYRIIKSHTLLENIIWSLACLDNEIINDSTNVYRKRIITKKASDIIVEYTNIDSQSLLYGYLFQTYNTEKLKHVKVFVNDGFLKKILFIGENINKTVLFEYENNVLCKEKIIYYNNGVENYSEEFSFVKGKT